MRILVLASCCIATVLLLQGCGGGGSSTTCQADKFDLKSQSFVGSANFHTSTNVVGQKPTVMAGKAQLTEKLDLEQFSFRMDESFPLKLRIANQTIDEQVDMKMVLVASAKMVVVYTKTVASSGKVSHTVQNCTAHKVENMPSVQELKTGFQSLVLPMVQEAMTCGGNDGTYDTWKVEKSFDGPVPPQIMGHKLPANATATGQVSEKVQMNKQSLLHSATTSMDATVKVSGKEMISTKTSVDLQGSSTSGGPSKDDLDYSKWGDCKPSDQINLNNLFQAPAGSMAGQVMEGFESHGVLLKHIIAVLQADGKTATKSIVV